MKKASLVIGWAIALVLVAASPPRVLAQGEPDDDLQRNIAKCVRSQCLFGGVPVLGAPFTADATTIWRPPANSGRRELRATARYYRDSMGRVRVDQRFVGHGDRPQRIFMATDPANRAAYMLDVAHASRTRVPLGMAEMMVAGGGRNSYVLPLSMQRFVVVFHFSDAMTSDPGDIVGESLDSQIVGGVRATGTRYETHLPLGVVGTGVGERWVSPDLKLVVYARHQDATIGVVEYQLRVISRAEPRPELFEVPADYVEVAPKFPLTWENPYSKTWSLDAPVNLD